MRRLNRKRSGRDGARVIDIATDPMREARARAAELRAIRPEFYVTAVGTLNEAYAIEPYLQPFSVVVVATDPNNLLMKIPTIDDDDA